MKEKGFTLIELLIVLALIAILAVILIVVIKPGQIFTRARDTQRSGDLRNLSQAVDAYLIELAANPSLAWPARGGCTNSTTQNIFFSISTTSGSWTDGWPTGWPSTTTHTALGTSSQAIDSSGWVPLNFGLVSVLNISQLPLDPRNGQTGSVNGTTTMFVYSFACDQTNFNYEFAAKLESGTSSMANDGGNRNCTGTDPRDCLYEVGPGKASLY
jgi:prepilin-type N-terminal cleavage/methylation domain-containing protein